LAGLRRWARAALRPLAGGLRFLLQSDPRLAEALRPASHYLGDHTALTRLHSGERIFVDTRDSGICSHILLEGRWESWVENALRQIVKPGMRVVDGGAHVGYYTLRMASWVGRSGRVEAFEPNPVLMRRLRRSVAVNGFGDRVRLHEAALLDRNGEAEFGFRHDLSGGGAIEGAGERFPVTTVTLDTALADTAQVDVLKLDLEGAELRALRGALRLVAASPRIAIVLEFHAPSLAAAGEAPLGFLAQRASEGFTLREIGHRSLGPSLAPEALLAAVGEQRTYLLLTR
jgi:FkbM family methyltransferase